MKNQALENTTLSATRTIRRVITHLVEHRGSVVVQELPRSTHTLVVVKVHDADYGKVIGAKGATYHALRLICETIGRFDGHEVKFVVEDAESRPPMERPKFEEATDWNNAEIKELLQDVVRAMFGGQCDVEAKDVGKMTLLDVTGVPAMSESIRKNVIASLSLVFYAVGKVMGRSEVEVDLRA